MAKISPVSIKYLIHARFEAEGAIEKPDVIGALFGQTEGLLGADLEMRDLQREGKIGRIEVSASVENGRATGQIEIPTALDKSETTIIAAAIETIERIGPTEAKITVEKIEDVRGNKREYIMERAKKLLEQIQGGDMETSELKDTIKSSAKVSRMQEYGIERLPAGDISGNELIVVEGRADVVNLLKNGISNVIAMNGIHLPNTVKELSREKEVILFIDGDRGGKLIAKNVTENARVAFIAVAPDGKEVEELAGKEILIALRKKVPVRDFFSSFRRSSDDTYNPRDSHKENAEISSSNYSNSSQDSSALSDDQKKKILSIAEEISGTRKAVALSKNLEILGEITISSISSAIRRLQDAHALIIPGTVTKPMIYAAEQAGIKHIAAKNFSSSDTSINLISI